MKVGSSSANLAKANPIFSWPAFVFGSIATDITGSGNSIDSSMIGALSSHKVSPVVVFFNPMIAPNSPASNDSTSSLVLECILTSLPILSFLPFVELRTYEPLFITPEYILVKASFPTNGSVAILNAKAAIGASSEASLESSSPSKVWPWIAGMSNGDGK